MKGYWFCFIYQWEEETHTFPLVSKSRIDKGLENKISSEIGLLSLTSIQTVDLVLLCLNDTQTVVSHNWNWHSISGLLLSKIKAPFCFFLCLPQWPSICLLCPFSLFGSFFGTSLLNIGTQCFWKGHLIFFDETNCRSYLIIIIILCVKLIVLCVKIIA